MSIQKQRDPLAQIRAGMDAARQGIEHLNETERTLRTLHAERQRVQSQIADAGDPTDAVVATMRQWVDSQAAEHAGPGYAAGLRSVFSQGLERSGAAWRVTPASRPWFASDDGLTFGQLVALVPDLVKARLEALIRSVEESSPGPVSARLAQVEALDREIREIEDRHSELVDMAASLTPPIVLQHLEPVRQRRETERRRAAGAIL